MKGIKNIKLNKGDKLTLCYYDGQSETFIIDNDDINRIEVDAPKIRYYKIERPVKYETIYEAPKEILDKEEKEYLEHFLRPFKDRVNFIRKEGVELHYPTDKYITENIYIDIDKDTYSILPKFEKGKYYKGMELDKKYTLDELGLFKGE